MSLLDPTYPDKNSLYFVDGIVEHLRTYLGSNISWLEYNYGEQFTFDAEVNGARVLVPHVYVGADRYLQTTIDNKKNGTCFFIVNQSSASDYKLNHVNFYETEISIVFQANLKLIDDTYDEYFREQLIGQCLYYLRRPRGSFYDIKDITVRRDLNDVFSEFGYDVRSTYKFPLTAWRIDLRVVHQAECQLPAPRTACDILWDSLTQDDLTNCIIPRIDFCDATYRDALTQPQLDCIIDNNMLNLYPQEVYDYGNTSGAFNFDYTVGYSWQTLTLTGDITAFTFSNFPADKAVNFNLEVVQDGVGAHGITFTGSGIVPPTGITNTELQPNQGAGEKTTYAFQWDKNDLRIFISKDGDTL